MGIWLSSNTRYVVTAGATYFGARSTSLLALSVKLITVHIIRFITGETIRYGRKIDDATAELIEGDLFNALELSGRVVEVEKLLAPIVPTDILCVGLNYRKHAEEGGSTIPELPVLFIKSSNALNNPGDPIRIPRLSSQIDFEGELAVVIGKTCKDVRKDRALQYVFGYTIANDVSARDWQREKRLGGGQFARGKSFDGFCPLGPTIVTSDEIENPNALKLLTRVNSHVMQDWTTADMIFDVPTLIENLSSTMTLRPGTVLLTGTPHGVGFARTPPVWLKNGDTVDVEIEGLGTLSNPVV
ncbi:fumarylacetoacetate hydrolase family protein [Nocardia gipuzkoensis]|uniref:fumarylacetoacetate hydrolase family protein n=1 Tax=Nocardia gipuzkoensis TaxID=2749991 RepID=UPI001E38C43C|nr:fumarylacetoacetate hydrolase family protein [Nocardia gipuzkoensis]UGT67916.1 fumarylacetoacetate hydrolase family protein [Nocardia gipuzkoensis]